ncbi:MAG: hypothetical protein LBC76_08025 [Treponema sp.]|jgi:predicted RNA-binding Zn-ribbon protein involved in translation (DUF1610 family)|nr:hypothetical protein [Treponema sp.]
MSENAVAIVEKPRELSVVEVKAQVGKVHTLMQELMQEGTHYGESFPGDTKKNLLKPGADKLCFMFRLRPDFTQEIKELPNGHMEVITRCQIFHIESGQKIADGVGLATTMESKYRWRNAARKCPQCGKETIIKGKEEYGGGYVCFLKKGGCGAKFKENDPLITEQVVGKIENSDIADTYNTVIKMSKKRAYVDATITACAASDIFSQDAEDFKETGDSLAREANQEEPRDVTEPKKEAEGNTPAQANNNHNGGTEKTMRQKIIDEIAVTLKTLTPYQTEFFTDADKKLAREQIQKASDNEVLMIIAEHWNKELVKRSNEYVAIPFGDEPAPAQPTKPAVKNDKQTLSSELSEILRERREQQAGATQKTTTALPDDGFVDDIPGQEEQVPAMFEEPEAEQVGAGASEGLDIF